MKFFEPMTSLVDEFWSFFWMAPLDAWSAVDDELSLLESSLSSPHAPSASDANSNMSNATQRDFLMTSLPSL